MKQVNQSFAERLIALRQARGLSQAELARRVGMSRRAMCYYEREAKKPPPVGVVVEIAEQLGVSVDSLLSLPTPRENDRRTIDGQFWQKWERLGPEERKAINRVADALLTKHG